MNGGGQGGFTAIINYPLISAAFVLTVSKGQLTQKCVFVSKVSKLYSKLAKKRGKAQPE